VYAEDIVQDLKQLYTGTMAVFALMKLMEGEMAEAQRLYENVQVSKQDNLIFKWFRTRSFSPVPKRLWRNCPSLQ
jgi:hypothetical protein